LIKEENSLKLTFLVLQKKKECLHLFGHTYSVLTFKKNLNITTIVMGRTPSNFKFNGILLFYNYNLTLFLTKQHFGINKYFVKQLEQRLEMNKSYPFNSYIASKWPTFYKFISNIIPNTKTIMDKLILNLNFLFLIRSYRGWRHSFSLPSRGQRT
jgi:ribosomal protein S13